MAHESQRDFIRLVSTELQNFFCDARVLEVGSLNINGTVRDFFSNCSYVGIDVAPGKDVDVVCQGQDYDAVDESFDHIISCEAMEHNPYWRGTFNNMVRLCKPGGLITMTCATTGRPEHGTTRSSPSSSPLTVEQGWDYYHNLTRKEFARECNLSSAFSRHQFWANWSSYDLFFLGLKKSPNISSEVIDAWDATLQSVDQYLAGVHRAKDLHYYRSLMARIGGDKLYEAMRRLRAR
jgi:SAM-dependent methyltransferase